MAGSLPTIVQGPKIAANIFNAGGFPRQRHVFMVQFTPSGQASKDSPDWKNIPYVVKHVDRPKVSMKTEELNQYNKKRQIYTGFKYEPMRLSFYDSSDGAAQKMWLRYAQYYFGDFDETAPNDYAWDVEAPAFLNHGTGFGLTEHYAGATDNNAQFFFNTISISHFYQAGSQHLYDQYVLKNPRISSFEPDELDYESGAVSQINMTVVFENLQYIQSQQVSADAFPEMFTGLFADKPPEVPTSGGTTLDRAQYSSQNPSNPSPSSLINQPISSVVQAAAYRAANSLLPTGALAAQGNYQYGSTASGIGTLANALGSNAGSYNVLNTLQTGTAQYGLNTGTLGSFNPLNYFNQFASQATNILASTVPNLLG